MVSKTKALKAAFKGEWKEFKDLASGKIGWNQPSISERYKKNIQKQKRTESRLAQRTGNQYMKLKNVWSNPK
jgi:hypothetical protein